jgi:hypothetical protein
MSSFEAPPDKKVRKEDFTDADGDGVILFRVYHFGPGTPVRLATHASVTRQSNGDWHLAANAPVKVTLPGKIKARIQAPDGTFSAEVPGEISGKGATTLLFDEKLLGGGSLSFRAN